MRSNSAIRKGDLNDQAERNYRKKSGSRNLFLMHGRFADFARGSNDLRISSRGVVLNIRLNGSIEDDPAKTYLHPSAERLMRRRGQLSLKISRLAHLNS